MSETLAVNELSPEELAGWHQVAKELHTYPAELQEIAKGHLEKHGIEISPEHHQAHIDIARPTIPNIDSFNSEEQDFIGEIIELGETAIDTTPLPATDDNSEKLSQYIGGSGFQDKLKAAYHDHKEAARQLVEAETELEAARQAYDKRSDSIRWKREGHSAWAKLGRRYYNFKTRKHNKVLDEARKKHFNAKFALDYSAPHIQNNAIEDHFHTALLDAEDNGVKIKTQDPDEYSIAQQRAHNTVDTIQWRDEMGIVDLDAPITGLDVTRISKEALAENAARYPEMTLEIGPKLLEQVKTALLTLPLLHGTKSKRLYAGHTGRNWDTPDTPTSHENLERLNITNGEVGQRHNTYRLDKQLGLDEYVFMTWGRPDEKYFGRSPGARCIMIDPNILLDDECIVTPSDAGGSAANIGGINLSDGIENSKQLARLEADFLSKVVSGKDWLEIVSRRIAQGWLNNPTSAHTLSLGHGFALGEIKYRGIIPRSAILGIMDSTDLPRYEEEIEAMTEGLVSW